jgi:hypothetical protein
MIFGFNFGKKMELPTKRRWKRRAIILIVIVNFNDLWRGGQVGGCVQIGIEGRLIGKC